METYSIKNLTFKYPGREEAALNGLNLAINPGEFIALCGPSGSGKSTLLVNLKPILAPHGEISGSILFKGKPIRELDQLEQAAKIGFVFQNPDAQIVTDKVWHELAFGLESLGLDTETIRLRVAEMASFFGIQTWFDMDVDHLSGGQKQLLNLAAVMVMQPEVLILDEPTSQLDPIAAGDFLDTVRKINRELGTTIIISEHRLEEVLPMADRTVVLDKGKVIADAPVSQVGIQLANMEHSMFAAMPTPVRAYSLVGGTEAECPVDVRQGRHWLTEAVGAKPAFTKLPEETYKFDSAEVALELKDVWFRYEKNGNDIVKDLSLQVKKGEFLAIVGGNGTGKTTSLSVMGGMRKPYRGKVTSNLTRAMLPQNPQSLFVASTVRDDLAEVISSQKQIEDIARLVHIDHLLDYHPYDLSGGEQQRAALAKVLLLEPEILLLDEPTKGLDNAFKNELAIILQALRDKGVTIVMVSHDVEFCARYADRSAMFFNGQIVTEGTPRKFFSGNSFYTTAGNRMSRHVFTNAVTAEDIAELVLANVSGKGPEEGSMEGLEGATEDSPDGDPESGSTGGGSLCESEAYAETEAFAKTQSLVKPGNHLASKKNLLTLASMVAAFATIFIGFYVMENKHYLAVCILIVLYTMVPFFAAFEERKPQARELVIMAVLIAAAVVGRGAFFMVPFFKPIVAIIIISGVSSGKEAGFMVGAMSAFVSNFIFGQGPWTPWQMMAMAVIGYLAGLIFHRYKDTVGRWPLIIFGGLATFFLYGAIVDIWTILVMNPQPTIETALVVYGAALYPNLIHASATVIFLALLSKPMLEKLNRVKLKYGMM